MIESAPLPNLRVSYSSLNTYASCHRKFELSKMIPQRRSYEDNYAADVGKAMHAGFQNYLVTQDEDIAILELMKAFPFEDEWNQPNTYRSFDACLSTFESMLEEGNMYEYELAQIKRPDGSVGPAIEVPFEIQFEGLTLPDGRGISFVGFIDAILQHRLNRRYKTLDIKTTREKLDDSTPKYFFDTQQVPYGIVLDHVANGKVDSFDVLYLDTYIDLVEPTCKLYEFPKTSTDVQEWFTNRVMQMEDIVRFEKSQYYPRTDSGCMFWKKPCRYFDVCGNRDREFLKEWFLLGDEPAPEEPWNPWIIAKAQAA